MQHNNNNKSQSTISIAATIAVGVFAGLASAFYLAYNYYPLYVNGTIHALIFASGLVAIFAFLKKVSIRIACWYIAGALPVHLAIHFFIIGDILSIKL